MNKEISYFQLLTEMKECEATIKHCEDNGITKSRQYGKATNKLIKLEECYEDFIKRRESMYHSSHWFEKPVMKRLIVEQEITQEDVNEFEDTVKSICEHGKPYTFKKHAEEGGTKWKEVKVEKVLKIWRTK